MKQQLTLKNLSCQNCVKHVTAHFLTLPSVSAVEVDLEKQIAIVTTEIAHSLDDYRASLQKTIYQVTSLEQ